MNAWIDSVSITPGRSTSEENYFFNLAATGGTTKIIAFGYSDYSTWENTKLYPPSAGIQILNFYINTLSHSLWDAQTALLEEGVLPSRNCSTSCRGWSQVTVLNELWSRTTAFLSRPYCSPGLIKCETIISDECVDGRIQKVVRAGCEGKLIPDKANGCTLKCNEGCGLQSPAGVSVTIKRVRKLVNCQSNLLWPVHFRHF